jgi:hypothetical protein
VKVLAENHVQRITVLREVAGVQELQELQNLKSEWCLGLDFLDRAVFSGKLGKRSI